MQKISLKEARLHAGLTQEEVARQIHRGRQTIEAWESGKRVIDAVSFLLLCRIYQIDIDNIFLPCEYV
ncbi:MAG: helix-turn-helix transcriptional regulator [Schwartzia sp.]|nr:helix-turn-helix transcriptional regulator [Schwartzia sp. (in: firmicutes)]